MMNAKIISNRYYSGLDILRAALMLIGVFYHTACLISPYYPWIYNSTRHQSANIYKLVYIEHLFRMETFFLISGFLSQMVLFRKGKRYFLHSRWLRVALPLIFACLSLNFLLHIFRVQFMGQQWEDYNISLAIQHGWFLVTLFIFALVDLILPKNLFFRFSFLHLVVAIIACWCGYFTIHYFGRFWVSLLGDHLLWILIFNSLKYYPFYLLGSWFFFQQERIEHIHLKTILGISLLAALFVSIRYCYDLKIYSLFLPLYQKSYLLGESIYQANFIFSGLTISFLIFYFFYLIERENNALIRYLIQSSIVIYLFHHPLVIIFGWIFDHFSFFSNRNYFLMVVSTTFLFSFVFYESIKRISWLRLAFGLKT